MSQVLTLVTFLLVTQVAADQQPTALPSPACIACRIDVEQLRSAYSADDWTALTRGEIVTSRSDGAQSGTGEQATLKSAALIAATPAQVWSVVIDFESRPKFIPGAKEIRIVRTEGNRVWVAEAVRVLWTTIRFQAINTLEPDLGRVTWALDKDVPHDIAETKGSWQVAPLPDGRRTLLQYRAYIDSGRPVPGFIESFLMKRSFPKVVGGLRAEVERRFPRREISTLK